MERRPVGRQETGGQGVGGQDPGGPGAGGQGAAARDAGGQGAAGQDAGEQGAGGQDAGARDGGDPTETGREIAAMTVGYLRTDNRSAPLGVDSAAPQLSWILQSKTRGDTQTAYRILVASTPALLAVDTGDLWDSGKVSSVQQNHDLARRRGIADSRERDRPPLDRAADDLRAHPPSASVVTTAS
jgi:hypothetical protein